MAIILVEGCDGSGKTTLIERARENQKDRYFVKVSAARYQPNLQTAFKYLTWVKQVPFDLILDRLHFLSDRVYGPTLRNEDMFKSLPLSFGLQSMDAIVYCRPPFEEIQKNVAKDKHLSGVAEHIATLSHDYDIIMKRIEEQQISRVFRYDYTVDEPIAFWRYVWSQTKKG